MTKKITERIIILEDKLSKFQEKYERDIEQVREALLKHYHVLPLQTTGMILPNKKE